MMLKCMETKSNDPELTQKQTSKHLGFQIVPLNDLKTIFQWTAHICETNTKRKKSKF